MTAERPDEGVPASVTTALPDYHLLRPNIVAIPFMVETHGEGLFAGSHDDARCVHGGRGVDDR